MAQLLQTRVWYVLIVLLSKAMAEMADPDLGWKYTFHARNGKFIRACHDRYSF